MCVIAHSTSAGAPQNGKARRSGAGTGLSAANLAAPKTDDLSPLASLQGRRLAFPQLNRVADRSKIRIGTSADRTPLHVSVILERLGKLCERHRQHFDGPAPRGRRHGHKQVQRLPTVCKARPYALDASCCKASARSAAWARCFLECPKPRAMRRDRHAALCRDRPLPPNTRRRPRLQDHPPSVPPPLPLAHYSAFTAIKPRLSSLSRRRLPPLRARRRRRACRQRCGLKLPHRVRLPRHIAARHRHGFVSERVPQNERARAERRATCRESVPQVMNTQIFDLRGSEIARQASRTFDFEIGASPKSFGQTKASGGPASFRKSARTGSVNGTVLAPALASAGATSGSESPRPASAPFATPQADSPSMPAI